MLFTLIEFDGGGGADLEILSALDYSGNERHVMRTRCCGPRAGIFGECFQHRVERAVSLNQLHRVRLDTKSGRYVIEKRVSVKMRRGMNSRR